MTKVYVQSLWLACAAVGAALLSQSAFLMAADIDMFHEMALVREALGRRHLPLSDVFSYVPTRVPVVHHEWGTGVVLYAVAVAAGLGSAGIVLLKYLLIAAIAAFAWAGSRRRGAAAPVALTSAVVVVPLLAVAFSTVRAQLFTLACTAGLLWVLARAARQPWLVAWLVPLFLLWVNLHAGVVVGLGLLALHLVELAGRWTLVSGARLRPSVVAVASTLLVTVALLPLATPYGTAYLPALLDGLTLPRPQFPEWRPLWDAPQALVLGTAHGVTVLGTVLAARHHGLTGSSGLLMVAATTVLAWLHVRHASIHAVVWFSIVPPLLSAMPVGQSLTRWWRATPVVPWVIALNLAAVTMTVAVHQQFWALRVPVEADGSQPVYPAGVVAYLDGQQASGHLMTPFEIGAYVSWHLHPAVKVGIDSRHEVAYPPGWLDEVLALYRADAGWERTLAAHHTDFVLARRTAPVVRHLNAADGWWTAYEDVSYVLFARASWQGRLTPSRMPDAVPPSAFP